MNEEPYIPMPGPGPGYDPSRPRTALIPVRYWCIRLRVWWLHRRANYFLAELDECHRIERAALKSARQCWARAMRLRARVLLLQGLLP